MAHLKLGPQSTKHDATASSQSKVETQPEQAEHAVAHVPIQRSFASPPPPLKPSTLLGMQHSLGNQFIQRRLAEQSQPPLLYPGTVQRQLAARPPAAMADHWLHRQTASGVGGGQKVQSLGVVFHNDGEVTLRKQASTSGAAIKKLPQGTKLFVDQKLAGGWYYVTLPSGDNGYVAQSHINMNIPEPGATLYKIQPGQSAIGIAEQHYKQEGRTWGQDLRFYVNVLEYVNRGKGERGIYKPSPDASWEDTKVRENFHIWIPSVSFAKTLKGKVGSGSITNDLWEGAKSVAQGAVNFAVGGGALIAGLLHGAVESVWHVLVGIKDLAVMAWDVIKSIFTGNILNDASNLWNMLSNLDYKQIAEDWIENFQNRWNDSSIFKRWHFRGWVIGYAIAEIAMLVFTAGTLTGAKWAAKMGKVAKVLERVPGVTKLKTLVKQNPTLKSLRSKLGKKPTTSRPAPTPAPAPSPTTAAPVSAPVSTAAPATTGAAAATTAIRYTVSPRMRNKILWGMQQLDKNGLPGKKIIGGHFRGILGHPNYAVEIVGVSSVNPDCVLVKFYKLLPNGQLSNIKSPASTLFPKGWSKNQVIKAIEEVANNPNPTAVIQQSTSRRIQGTVRGLHIEVVVEPSGAIIAGYPL